MKSFFSNSVIAFELLARKKIFKRIREASILIKILQFFTIIVALGIYAYVEGRHIICADKQVL